MILNDEDLNVREDNPYYGGVIIEFPEGDYLLESKPLFVSKSPRDRFYTTIEDEQPGMIAKRAYDSFRWWWLLTELNGVELGFTVDPGITLLVPDLDKFKITR